ncbi:MAG: MFS transporter, partial [Alphaproteobacteria bacterium]
VWGATAPFAGAIADRYGAGRVVIGGALVNAIGLITMAFAPSAEGLIGSGILLGIGISGTGFTAVLGAVGRAAPAEKRSVALGLTSAGGSLGQFAALPYVHLLIGEFGWVMSLIALALTAALLVPISWGVAGTPRSSTTHVEQNLTEAFREAVTHKGFLLLTAGFFVCGFHVVFVATHLPAFLADRAFEPWVATWALALIGLANVVGTYLCGKAGQVMEQRVALSWLYIGRAVIFLGFLYVPLTETTVLLLSAAIGLFWLGTVPLTSGLIATLFGPRWMSMLFGLVFFSHQIGSFLGAWLGGYFYDVYQSYEVMWWISVALGIVAALFHWPIREVPVARLRPDSA